MLLINIPAFHNGVKSIAMTLKLQLILGASFIFLLDQITKLIIVAKFELGESIRVFPFFHLTFVTNTGTAFGLFQGVNLLFIIITISIIVGMIVWRKNFLTGSIWATIGFCMVLGGALGNLSDRIFRHVVVDFLDFLVWPVFNIADMSICIGTGLLALFCCVQEKKCPAPVKEQ